MILQGLEDAADPPPAVAGALTSSREDQESRTDCVPDMRDSDGHKSLRSRLFMELLYSFSVGDRDPARHHKLDSVQSAAFTHRR